MTAHTKTECQEKLAKLREECGRRSEKIKPDMPFGDWIDFWYQNYSAPKLRPTTQACYSGRIYTHIIPSIGNIPLNKLTQNDLQQFYARLKKSGRIKSMSINSEKGCPTAWCAHAIRPAARRLKRR
ncbi:MAG: N-terminal phage integrase SAM-like domain-containing protein [Oscillospiraceae bacterium]|nr:MAG: N-terminal phage integrase SAM-like domain-containing protein [Oscillospiraceae bacterium]